MSPSCRKADALVHGRAWPACSWQAGQRRDTPPANRRLRSEECSGSACYRTSDRAGLRDHRTNSERQAPGSTPGNASASGTCGTSPRCAGQWRSGRRPGVDDRDAVQLSVPAGPARSRRWAARQVVVSRAGYGDMRSAAACCWLSARPAASSAAHSSGAMAARAGARNRSRSSGCLIGMPVLCRMASTAPMRRAARRASPS